MKDKFKSILEPITELLVKKRNDYGNNYSERRDKRGSVAFYLRVEDKLSRIEQLDNSDSQVMSESIEDSLNDIIGYCVLEIEYRRGIKLDKPRGNLVCMDGWCTNELIKHAQAVESCKYNTITGKGIEWFNACPRRSGNDN